MSISCCIGLPYLQVKLLLLDSPSCSWSWVSVLHCMIPHGSPLLAKTHRPRAHPATLHIRACLSGADPFNFSYWASVGSRRGLTLLQAPLDSGLRPQRRDPLKPGRLLVAAWGCWRQCLVGGVARVKVWHVSLHVATYMQARE